MAYDILVDPEKVYEVAIGVLKSRIDKLAKNINNEQEGMNSLQAEIKERSHTISQMTDQKAALEHTVGDLTYHLSKEQPIGSVTLPQPSTDSLQEKTWSRAFVAKNKVFASWWSSTNNGPFLSRWVKSCTHEELLAMFRGIASEAFHAGSTTVENS